MRKTIICISILIIIGLAIPFIVHSNSPNVTSEITADGTIEYIIGYLSFITTGALAVYAIFQTKQANDMSKQLLEIEKNNFLMQICPFISITKYDIAKYTSTEILNNKKNGLLKSEHGI